MSAAEEPNEDFGSTSQGEEAAEVVENEMALPSGCDGDFCTGLLHSQGRQIGNAFPATRDLVLAADRCTGPSPARDGLETKTTILEKRRRPKDDLEVPKPTS